ncbi:MAG TPA: hypothetical protein PKH31_14425 [Candidatus Sumerlaeota bacterium]|nr:hypothetical protein [Candidatus Sumerlaeota bacterium]
MGNMGDMHKKMGQKVAGWLVLSLLVFGAAACDSQKAPEANKAEGAKTTETVKETALKDATPDEAVRQAALAIHDAKPEVLWAMLPASYQQDVSDVVKQFGTAMDNEVWTSGTALLPKAIKVLNAKQDIILGAWADLDQQGATTQTAQTNSPAQRAEKYKAVVEILTDISKSRILKLDFLRNPDMKAFLAEDGGPLIQKVFTFLEKPGMFSPEDMDKFVKNRAKLKDLKVTVKENKDDQAVVMTMLDDKETSVALTKVEGKWVTADMAKNWKQNVDEIKANLTQMATDMPQKKQQVLMQVAMVSSVINSVAKVSTKEELSGVLMGLLMGGAMGGGMPGGDMNAPENENGMGGMMMPPAGMGAPGMGAAGMGGMMPPPDAAPAPMPALPGGAAPKAAK